MYYGSARAQTWLKASLKSMQRKRETIQIKFVKTTLSSSRLEVSSISDRNRQNSLNPNKLQFKIYCFIYNVGL